MPVPYCCPMTCLLAIPIIANYFCLLFNQLFLGDQCILYQIFEFCSAMCSTFLTVPVHSFECCWQLHFWTLYSVLSPGLALTNAHLFLKTIRPITAIPCCLFRDFEMHCPDDPFIHDDVKSVLLYWVAVIGRRTCCYCCFDF